MAPGKVPVTVIDELEPIEIHQQDGKRPVGSSRALDLALQNIHQAAVICQPRQTVADGERADLAEQLRIVEQTGAQKDHVAYGVDQFRAGCWHIEQTRRLRCDQMTGGIEACHPNQYRIECKTVTIFPAVKDNGGSKKQGRGKQFPWSRHGAARMDGRLIRGNQKWQNDQAKCADNNRQCSDDVFSSVPRPWHLLIDGIGDKKEQPQERLANHPGYGDTELLRAIQKMMVELNGRSQVNDAGDAEGQ